MSNITEKEIGEVEENLDSLNLGDRASTSSTTTIVLRSRFGSLQIVHGSTVSTLPQTEHSQTVSAATCVALASGSNNWSFFLIRCKAARRAERGPSPGSFESNWISVSISGPVTREDMVQFKIA